MSSLGHVLITGADGFTGKHLTKLFNESGIIYHSLKANLLSTDTLIDEIHNLDFKKVIHLAAISSTKKDKDFTFEVNKQGTLNLLDALSKKKGIEKVILASSANVYSNSLKGMIDIKSNLEPFNDYGKSKLEMEIISKDFKNIFDITIARPFNYTGIGQDESFLIPKLIKSFIENKEIIELGNINISREFNDVRDICEIYKILLTTNLDITEINLCSGRFFSIKEIISKLESIFKRKIQINQNKNLFREGESKILYGNPSEIIETLNYNFQFSIDETLNWMINQHSES